MYLSITLWLNYLFIIFQNEIRLVLTIKKILVNCDISYSIGENWRMQ